MVKLTFSINNKTYVYVYRFVQVLMNYRQHLNSGVCFKVNERKRECVN